VNATDAGLIGGLGGAAIVGTFSIWATKLLTSAERKRAHAVQLADRKADAYLVLMEHLVRLRFFLRWLDGEVKGKPDSRITQPELLGDDRWNQMAAMVGAFGSNDAYSDFRGLQDQVRELATDVSVASRRVAFGKPSPIQFRRLGPTELPDRQDRVERIRAGIVSLEQMVRTELAVPQS
jgi:hypothetical protein